MINNSTILNLNPAYIVLVGIILIIIGLLQPNDIYKPQIVISHNSWKRKNIPMNKKNNSISDILLQIISGVMVGFILHICGI